MTKFEQELFDERLALGIITKTNCSRNENKEYKALYQAGEPLPDNIHCDPDEEGKFIRIVHNDIAKEDIDALLECRRVRYLGDIKNALLYIAVIISVPLFLGVFGILTNLR